MSSKDDKWKTAGYIALTKSKKFVLVKIENIQVIAEKEGVKEVLEEKATFTTLKEHRDEP
jgi:hypothetical protein